MKVSFYLSRLCQFIVGCSLPHDHSTLFYLLVLSPMLCRYNMLLYHLSTFSSVCVSIFLFWVAILATSLSICYHFSGQRVRLFSILIVWFSQNVGQNVFNAGLLSDSGAPWLDSRWDVQGSWVGYFTLSAKQQKHQEDVTIKYLTERITKIRPCYTSFVV